MAQLTVLLLGPPLVTCNGAEVVVDTRKAIALLSYLAITRQPHSRDTLAAMFWPDTRDSRARLRRTLSALHIALARSWLDTGRETIGLEFNAHLAVDAEQFVQHATLAKSLDAMDARLPQHLAAFVEAVALYRNDFMSGFSLRDSPAFDEWQQFQAERMRRDLAAILERLTQVYSMDHQFNAAISAAQRWVGLDPLDEAAQRMLMTAYTWAGQRSAALRQFHECARTLEEELGVAPLPVTVELFERIRDGADLPLGRPTAAPGPERTQPLPPPAITSQSPVRKRVASPPRPASLFVGREDELAYINARLSQPDCRLLTVVGGGGMGKTRLALEAVNPLQGMFADGVCFVALVDIAEAALLLPHLAEALGLTLRGRGDARQQVHDYLREKQMLLLLDNMEHLIDGSDQLAELLQAAPEVKLLVTSRERLNISGEWVLLLQGVSMPVASQLFVSRAQSALATFAPNSDDWDAIGDICNLVQGMPLGVELAAAWTPLLSCAEIAAEINRSFTFLRSDARDLPDRHRNMRAIFDYSWQQLRPEEQRVLAGCAVFRGGFSRVAATEVAGADASMLRDLLHKSLVQRQEGDRYGMHELLRQYAAERLADDAAAAAGSQQRHAHFYANWLARQSLLTSADVTAVGQEIENLRAAWRWAIAESDLTTLDRMLEPLHRWYSIRSWFQEAFKAFGSAIAHVQPLRSSAARRLLARLQSRQATCCYLLGQLVEGRRLAEAALDYTRPHGEQAEICQALLTLGAIAHRQGSFTEAHTLLQECLNLATALGDLSILARAQHTLGLVYIGLGGYRSAWRAYNESLSTMRLQGNEVGRALTLTSLSALACRMGNYYEAQRYGHEGLQQAEHTSDLYAAGLALINLGLASEALGELVDAERYHQAALQHLQTIGYRDGIAGCLNNLCNCALELGDTQKAQELEYQALAIFREIGNPAGVALCLDRLGVIASQRNDLTQAQQHLTEALAIYEEIDDRYNIADTLEQLGRLSLVQGEPALAREQLRRGIALAHELQATPVLLGLLLPWADLLWREGKQAEAQLVLQMVVREPALSQAHRDYSARLRETWGPTAEAAAEPPDAPHTLNELLERLAYKTNVAPDVV